ncbi:LysR family transcriptional regulator [Aminipila luticellarii]|uniref:LysR family transcriptional regulator n=1 Tax=Aminipila luticellarii TaxID=2507160 RepID=A0A410PWE6_9FIRM|nr:LysR family transcriptional regulator [Aminipila luticellarii]QAT43273.1 LysR family transcriptional regulator [Aminipila luticellarii]
MDLIKYEIFLSIADRGSYSKVCEEFGYTQSGISKMMNSMENEIGFPLIVRNNKGISLTAEGKRMLPLVRQLIKDKGTLEEEFSSIRGVETGMVRIGSFPTAAYVWMPGILRAFHQRFPGIQVEVIEDNNINLLEQWLNQGFIDLGIFSKQAPFHFDWTSIKQDPFVALLPKNHPLGEKQIIPIDELFEENVVLFRSHEGEDPDTYCWMKHVHGEIHPVFTTNSDFTTIRVVEQNGFVTILPELIAKYAVDSYDVIYRPLDIQETREIGIAVRTKERISPAAKKFIQYAKDNML